MVLLSLRLFTATIFNGYPFSMFIRKIWRPIRPNPLIATLGLSFVICFDVTVLYILPWFWGLINIFVTPDLIRGLLMMVMKGEGMDPGSSPG